MIENYIKLNYIIIIKFPCTIYRHLDDYNGMKMLMITVRNNENNQWKNWSKNKDRKEQRTAKL